MNTDFIGIINLVSGIVPIIIGFIALLSNSKNKVKTTYFLSALSLGSWTLSLFFYSNPLILDSTTWLKIVYTCAYAMTLSQILFARVYPKENKERFKYLFWIVLFLMLLCIYYLWFTNLIVIDTNHSPETFNTIAKMGVLYPLYALPEVITAFYVVGYYIEQSKSATGVEKRQVQFYVIGGIIMLLPVFLFDFFLPMIFGNTYYYKYSTLGNVVWTILVGYSILKTRFLDIRVFVGIILEYLTKSILIILFSILLYLFSRLISFEFTVLDLLKLIPITLIFSIAITKLFSITEKYFSQQFVYKSYHPIKTLQEYNKEISKQLEISTLINQLAQTIDKAFSTTSSKVLILDSNRNLVSKSHDINNTVTTEEIYSILEIWENLNSNRTIIYSEFKNSRKAGKRMIDNNRDQILSFMERNHIEIMYPLEENYKYTGVVVIGQKEDKTSYTITDIEFLESLIQSTQIALARALLYFEVQNFNKSLQQKVNEQTKELQIKVEQLQEARRKESDMIDIMGHELRTPATVVKLNADFLTKFTDEIKSSPDNYKKYVTRIQEAIENEIKLINTLLSSAKLEGDKIELNPEEIDIKKEIDMALHGNEQEANKKELKLINRTDIYTPNIYADKARLVEVLNNLISNGVKYTKQGGVVVTTTYDQDYVKISIIDTGNGIPQKDIPRLGQKFYRINNYIESSKDDNVDVIRPGGTGLGLYVTFNLVKKMGGEVTVQSEVGKGSIFSFTIPRYKGQKSNTTTSSQNMFEKLGLKK